MVKKLFKRVSRAVNLATAAGAWYLATARPWILQWGATDEEAEASLPGDELITHPRHQTTRAVTIQAPPAVVWGDVLAWAQDPAGFATPERLGRLFGWEHVTVHATELEEGQAVPFPGPHDKGEHGGGLQVAHVDPERALVLRGTWVPGQDETAPPTRLGPGTDGWLDGTWAMVLEPEPGGGTRLIARARFDVRGLKATVVTGATEPLHFLAERRALLRIKERAEARRIEPPP